MGTSLPKTINFAFTNAGFILLALAYLINFSRAASEIDLPFVNPYAYRQSQTALGIREYAEEGLSLLHEIPTFGEPWVLPMEFPIYQWTSAVLVRLSGWSIERCGRICSLFFFYLTIPLLVRLITLLERTPQQACCIAAMVLLSPTYQFWGRSVLIESTALFLSIAYLVFAISSLRVNGHRSIRGGYVAGALVFGVLAALVKITTFAVAFGFLVLYLAGRHWQLKPDWRKSRLAMGGLALVTFLSILCGKIWIDYSDAVKAPGRVTRQLTSAGLSEWNYGTLQLRFTSQYWGRFWEYGAQEAFPAFEFLQWGPDRWVRPLHLVMIAALLLCVAWSLSRQRKNIPIFLAFVMAFASGPLVFANLYVEHQYYWYANLWLLIIGLLYAIWDPDLWSKAIAEVGSSSQTVFSRRTVVTSVMMLVAFGYAIINVGAWKFHDFSDWQSWDKLRPEDKDVYLAMRSFAEQLPPDPDGKGVYLYAAIGPTTEVPYFLRRRTLFVKMKQPGPKEDDPVIEEAIALKRKGYRIEGLVELFPKTFVDPDIRKSVLDSLALEEGGEVIRTETCRCVLLRSRD